VGDRELVEIVALAALGNYMDTLADGLKVEVDEIVSQALASRRHARPGPLRTP
jgi:hypothetical protein